MYPHRFPKWESERAEFCLRSRRAKSYISIRALFMRAPLPSCQQPSLLNCEVRRKKPARALIMLSHFEVRMRAWPLSKTWRSPWRAVRGGGVPALPLNSSDDPDDHQHDAHEHQSSALRRFKTLRRFFIRVQPCLCAAMALLRSVSETLLARNPLSRTGFHKSSNRLFYDTAHRRLGHNGPRWSQAHSTFQPDSPTERLSEQGSTPTGAERGSSLIDPRTPVFLEHPQSFFPFWPLRFEAD